MTRMTRKRNWRVLVAAAAISGGLTGCANTDLKSADVSTGVATATKPASIPPEAYNGAIRAVPMPSAPLDLSKTLTRIVFASCAQQNGDQSLWNRVAAEGQDLTLFIGDNVYGDVRSGDPAQPELKAAYMRLARSEPFAAVRRAAPMITVWDDHDYGLNDAGADYAFRADSQALFNYVWDVPADDPRRARPGIYNAWTFGDDTGRRVQLIMLDTRYFRSPLKDSDERGAPGKERYLPDDDPEKTMLGEDQWHWLAQTLTEPADLRILVSSIQVLAEGHGWEAWRTLPRERERLYAAIRDAGADNVVILSGDRHSGGVYRRDDLVGFPLTEITSSSVNLPSSRWRAERNETYVEPGPYRLGGMVYDANYGILDIDWDASLVRAVVRGAEGQDYRTVEIPIR